MHKIASIIALVFLFSCSNTEKKSNQSESGNEVTNEPTDNVPIDTIQQITSSLGKYEIKSGIISFQATMEMTNINIKTAKILYFDDYGVKECEEEYEIDSSTGEKKLTKRTFVAGGVNYSYTIATHKGSKRKAIGLGVVPDFSVDETGLDKDSPIKMIANQTICGKVCKGFSMVTSTGTIQMFGWSRIVLKTTVGNPAMKMKSETVAVKIEENVAIPVDKFEIPGDIIFEDSEKKIEASTKKPSKP